MSQRYVEVINNTTLANLLTLPHKHLGSHPTGFVVRTDVEISPFPFTLCPLTTLKTSDTIPDSNPHDVVLEYKKENGDLETLLYTLWEVYKENHLTETSSPVISKKYYKQIGTLPKRKIIIPCLGRKENLVPTLRRLQTIHPPSEGYMPQICIVEHSPYPDLEKIATSFNCEYLWILLDPRDPTLPIGQFNKALCYDKAFLFTSPAEWYLFHDNDILVPKDFWCLLDKNVERAKTKFIQPYTHRCLLNTYPQIADMLRLNVDLADDGLTEDMRQPFLEGAPGGSLYLHRERYIEVGGHDPNYCWGYGPEDALFFNKLKLLEPIAYADDPPIEMIHLYHPTASVNNPFRHEMDWFVKIFLESRTNEEKRALMENKSQLLQMILKQIHD